MRPLALKRCGCGLGEQDRVPSSSSFELAHDLGGPPKHQIPRHPHSDHCRRHAACVQPHPHRQPHLQLPRHSTADGHDAVCQRDAAARVVSAGVWPSNDGFVAVAYELHFPDIANALCRVVDGDEECLDDLHHICGRDEGRQRGEARHVHLEDSAVLVIVGNSCVPQLGRNCRQLLYFARRHQRENEPLHRCSRRCQLLVCLHLCLQAGLMFPTLPSEHYRHQCRHKPIIGHYRQSETVEKFLSSPAQDRADQGEGHHDCRNEGQSRYCDRQV
mmetsp:Transcript_45479/g.92989  ORF Transcript_45479/g.92989 Transcript_45479/m.92989 type:complete len:273 (-) Transcript_45479:884-1702(-)